MHFDDVLRCVKLSGKVESVCANKLLVEVVGRLCVGMDAVSAVVKRRWSRNARLTALFTNILSASLLQEMSA